jgi:hypothetical protein
MPPYRRVWSRRRRAPSPKSTGVQAERVEAALWTPLHALEERAAVHRRMAVRQRATGKMHAAEKYNERPNQAVENAVVLRELIRRFDIEEEEGAA